MINIAIEQILTTYRMMSARDVETGDRDRLVNYLTMLVEGGETDAQRLTVCGLVYLRQLDGALKPAAAGFTGL